MVRRRRLHGGGDICRRRLKNDRHTGKMQALIRREELDRAFDARFLRGMKEKFLNARVAVAGLGGLGSNIAVMLARSGVGHLLLVDFDTVDVTN